MKITITDDDGTLLAEAKVATLTLRRPFHQLTIAAQIIPTVSAEADAIGNNPTVSSISQSSDRLTAHLCEQRGIDIAYQPNGSEPASYIVVNNAAAENGTR